MINDSQALSRLRELEIAYREAIALGFPRCCDFQNWKLCLGAVTGDTDSYKPGRCPHLATMDIGFLLKGQREYLMDGYVNC